MLKQELQLRYDSVLSLCTEMYYLYNQYDNHYNDNMDAKEWELLFYNFFKTILDNEFPLDGLIVEDFEQKISKNIYTWFFDPIDGTGNMQTGVSFFSSTFSLVKDNVVPVLSLTLDMIKGQVYVSLEEKNYCYNIKKKSSIPIYHQCSMSYCEYVLAGKVFGHSEMEHLLYFQKEWWKLAAFSKSYRHLGSTALQMIMDGWKRNIIVFSLDIRWFDVMGALHFLSNFGYSYKVTECLSCLIVYRPEYRIDELDEIIKIAEDKWTFLPLNTVKVSDNHFKELA